MKKALCLVLAILSVILCTACGSASGDSGTAVTTAVKPSNDMPEQTAAVTENKAPSAPGIDVDLTALSSTMVYSEVYNMMYYPEDYIGKKVKMHGQFALYQGSDANGDPDPNQIYYACVIADATACCQQGLEFVLEGDFSYPEDYPELGTEITVTGVFETYLEGQNQYCHLVGAEMDV